MEYVCDGCGEAHDDAGDGDDCERCGGHFCLDCYGQYHGDNCDVPTTSTNTEEA